MSYLLESSAATLANSSGYQRLASPYDAPGLIPITGAELVEDFKELLIKNDLSLEDLKNNYNY